MSQHWWSALDVLGRELAATRAVANRDGTDATGAVLQTASAALGAESSAIISYGGLAVHVHRWPDAIAPDLPTNDPPLEDLAARARARGIVRIRHGDGRGVSPADRETLSHWRMMSLVGVPLDGMTAPGLLVFGATVPRWPRPSIPTRVARLVGDLVGSTLARLRAERAVHVQEAELVHVARVATLGEFAASMAHELNQPLGAILASAQAGSLFLDADPPNLARVRDIVRRIATENRRASQIISRLRALFRRAPVERLPVRPDEIITDTMQLIEHEAATRHVALRVDVTPSLPAVRGDRIQLQQVLLNLVLNAFDAIAHPSSFRAGVLITALPRDDARVELAVRDGGTGIAPSALPHVFDPFFTTKQRGLGLGLAICRSIIESHGGAMFCRNNPDRGATVGFTLPALAEAR